MLKMRLQRVGRKHETAFRLVLTDSKNSTKSGKFNEILGSYDPRKSTDLLKTDRIAHWLKQGIAVTGSVHNLLVTHKLIDAKKINVLPKKTPIIKVSEPEAVVVKSEAPKAEEVKEDKKDEELKAAEPEAVTTEEPTSSTITEDSVVPEVSTDKPAISEEESSK